MSRSCKDAGAGLTDAGMLGVIPKRMVLPGGPLTRFFRFSCYNQLTLSRLQIPNTLQNTI